MDRGYVKLWRRWILDYDIIKQPPVLQLLLYILTHAAYKTRELCSYGDKIKLHPGDVIISRIMVSEALGISERQYRTALNKLVDMGIIAINPTSRYTLATIIDYDVDTHTLMHNDAMPDQKSAIASDDTSSKSQSKCEQSSSHRSINMSTRPTLEQIRDYCNNNQIDVDPDDFFLHYSSNGWMVGNSPMMDWQAAIQRWAYRAQKARQEVEQEEKKREKEREEIERDAYRYSPFTAEYLDMMSNDRFGIPTPIEVRRRLQAELRQRMELFNQGLPCDGSEP